MSERPLPKSLREFLAAHPGKFHEGWTEKDYSGGEASPWTHWVFLQPGWRNAVLDPVAPVHIIHEGTIKEVLRQFRGAKPCRCEECTRELESRKEVAA